MAKIKSWEIEASDYVPHAEKTTCYSGGVISDGDVVIMNGWASAHPQVVRADADAAATARGRMGVAVGNASASGQEIAAAPWRILRNQNTLGLSAGVLVYASSTAGGWTGTRPSGAVIPRPIGVVLNTSATVGVVYLAPNGTYQDDIIDGRQVLAGSNNNTTGVLPVLFRVTLPAGNVPQTRNVVVDHAIRVVDAWFIKQTGAGDGDDTVTVSSAGSAISNAMIIPNADTGVVRATSIDDANWAIAAAGTLRVASAQGGGAAGDGEGIAYVLCERG
ncbi:MAG: hypothetical protein QME96_05580 [Myxococcota bacterium]|nr:hypothetical protein [Myxococcota bacterium]